MVADGMGFLPIIKWLKGTYPGVTQPWYADYVGSLGTYYNIELYFNLLKQFGLVRGYYPKPAKSIIFMHQNNIVTVNLFGLLHGFKVFAGTRCLGGFIVDYDPNMIDCRIVR